MEEQEDQLNANRPESNSEAEDSLGNKEEQQTCNGSPEDPQQFPASVSPDSVTVELKEGDKEEKMDTRRETKKEEEDGSIGKLDLGIGSIWFPIYAVCLLPARRKHQDSPIWNIITPTVIGWQTQTWNVFCTHSLAIKKEKCLRSKSVLYW